MEMLRIMKILFMKNKEKDKDECEIVYMPYEWFDIDDAPPNNSTTCFPSA